MIPDPKILVVDDDPVNIALLKSFLEDAGYAIVPALNAGKALEALEKEIPALILLDIMMPGVDGYELCARIKTMPAAQDVPIVFVTAKDQLDDKIHGLDIGAVDYITKPIQREEFLARVKTHLGRDRQLRERIRNQAEKLDQLSTAQKALLIEPASLPQAKFAVSYKSLNEAGADFYDVISLSDSLFAYFVADISGHNLQASFATPAVKALFAQNARLTCSPLETLHYINDTLVNLMSQGSYVTACYVKLDRECNCLTLASAGHPPMVYQALGREPILIESDGDVLGAFVNVNFDPGQLQVQPGDRFFLYSDGIIEAGNTPREAGQARMIDACSKTAPADLTEAVEMICDMMLENTGEPEDDVVVLGVEV